MAEVPNDAFLACNAILRVIEASLQKFANITQVEELQRSEQLDLLALEQLPDRWRDGAIEVLRSIRRSPNQGNATTLTPVLVGSVSNELCPYAMLYRDNQCSFDDVAVALHSLGREREWTCKLCGTRVSTASMPFSSSISRRDHVYITPVGFFKGHSAGREGKWSCIWERVSGECSKQFKGRRDLLWHMQEVHVRRRESDEKAVVDFPGDRREQNAGKCGYGVRIASREMHMYGGQFVVDIRKSI
jgi:hypothetical protein